MKQRFYSFLVLFILSILVCTNSALAQKWTKLSATNGIGTTVCNDSSNGHYSCFAFRCGKGRGLEFAYLFSGGDFKENPLARVFIDNVQLDTLQFKAIDLNAELVSVYDPNQHGYLIKAMQSGKRLELVFDGSNVFSLRNSSRQIKKVLRQCAGEIRNAGLQKDNNNKQNSHSQINIQMFFNTDISGYDYANGLYDSRLANLSRDQCQDICISEHKCKAYTHNGDNNVCILKNNVGRSVPFPNASSGIVSNRPRTKKPLIQVNEEDNLQNFITADLSWRAKDTRGTYLERIRKSAEQYGESCETELPAIEKVQNSVSFTTKQHRQNVGKTFELDWRASFSGNTLPVYLIVSTSQPVRFNGTGYYTLMPGALGPFGIKRREANTRAVVPLFGNGVPQTGKINIRPIYAGKLAIETSVVGYQRKCKNEVSHDLEDIQLVALASKRPKVDLDTRLVESAADEYIISPDKTRLLETRTDGTVRLLNVTDRQVIADITGLNPVFSPTGRFFSTEKRVSAYGDDHKIYDSLDGQFISETNFLAWANNDSFIASAAAIWGGAFALNTLNPDISFTAGGNLSHYASGTDVGMRFDQENGYFIENEREKISISRLHLPDQKVSTPGRQRKLGSTAKFLPKYFQISPVSVPKFWSFAGKPKSPARKKRPDESQKEYDEYLKAPIYWFTDALDDKNLLLIPERIKNTELANLSGKRLNSSANVLRSVSADLNASRFSDDKISTRLTDFGIPFMDSTPTLFEKSVKANQVGSHSSAGEPQKKLAKLVASKIIKDVPQFRKIMPASEDYWGCGGRAFDYARKHIIGKDPVWIAHLVCTDGNGIFYNSNFMILSKSSAGGLAKYDLSDPTTSVGTECPPSLEYCAAKSAVFGDRYLVIWSSKARAFAIIDWKRGKLLHKKFNLPRGSTLERVLLLNNPDFVLQLDRDGTFFVHKLSANKVILNGRVVDDEVIVWNDNLQFDSTIEGAHLVNLKFEGLPGKYTFQQFGSRLRVAGLLDKVVANQKLPTLPNIQAPPSLSAQISVDGNQIQLKAKASSLGILKSLRVYQDGVLTDETEFASENENIDLTTPRIPGARWIALVAVDEEGFVSLPVGLDMGIDPVAKPKVRLLAVGIDKYNNKDVASLRFAKSDANTLTDSLSNVSARSIELVSKIVLANETASPTDILAAAEKLVTDTKSDEHAVFFFAGHGVKGEDGRYYMATSDTDPSNISDTALSWDRLASVLAKSKARMSVFIDACHSGAAGTDFFATNDDAAAGILKNIPSGLTVFSASKGREFSEESAQIGGGYFTIAVADVIAGNRKKYDTNKNGVIEVSELYVGIKHQVAKNTDGRQTPWLARNQMIGDFALF